MASTLARSSASRTARRSARISGVSAAGLRISPSSPPVQHTSAGADPFVGVARDGARTLRRLVVGVRVHRDEPQRVTGDVEGNGHRSKLAAARAVEAEIRRYIAPHVPAPLCVLRRARVRGGRVRVARARPRPRLGTSALGLSAWKSCGERVAVRGAAGCPVDYTQPQGPTVDLAVARLRATDPSRRLGSLVFNFGGPGDAGHETLPGFAATSPPRCGPATTSSASTHGARATRARSSASTTPRGRPPERGRPDAELRRRAAVVLRRQPRAGRSRRGVRRPERRRGWPSSGAATWPATSTGSVPRSATTSSSYVGFSYGTVIGAVYAQMFPDRVGRMVLDSPVDLSATALEELRGELGGLRAGARRLPRRLRRHSDSCAFRNDGDPSGALAQPPSPLRAGSAAHHRQAEPGRRRSRKAGVATFYTALHLRAVRQAVRLAVPRRRPRTTPQQGDGSLLLAPRRLVQRASRRRQLRQHQRGHRRHPLRRPRRRRPRPSTEYAAEYHRDVARVPVPRRVRREHRARLRPPPAAPAGDRDPRRRPRRRRRRRSWSSGTTRDPATPFAGAAGPRVAPRRFAAAHVRQHRAHRVHEEPLHQRRRSTPTSCAARCHRRARTCRS